MMRVRLLKMRILGINKHLEAPITPGMAIDRSINCPGIAITGCQNRSVCAKQIGKMGEITARAREAKPSWAYQRDWNTSGQSYDRELLLSITNYVLGEDS
ncbi:hypothetical protein UA08_06879 [Talaromyces atroroseus]|uniref:Uncharacterized protein n=1 Tax=Talaromyces atroroseus TaxID=1441469 RepID=A0A225AGD4_TALAT|nr:hypothetical protein UA08_06879 [Talaromyces atroroseus]OKL58223.1 hypothetical protein UA08_06879 [Talaromyces atroroseus]